MNSSNYLIWETNDRKKEIIVETVKTQNPQTVVELVKTVQQKIGLTEQEVNNFLLELEKEDKLSFNKRQTSLHSTSRGYFFSKEAPWYWLTIAIAIVTTISVFTIPENAYPVVYLRSALAVFFVLYLPGYAFIKMLFSTKISITIVNNNMDCIDRFALSIGMSLALTSMVGLFLNYTPLGIGQAPLTLSLLALTVAFTTAAALREFQSKQIKIKKETKRKLAYPSAAI